MRLGWAKGLGPRRALPGRAPDGNRQCEVWRAQQFDENGVTTAAILSVTLAGWSFDFGSPPFLEPCSSPS